MSRNIKELERELGVELFSRGYHAVELTPAGTELVQPVRELLSQLSQLRRIAQSAATTKAAQARTIRVGASHIAHPAILETVMDEARRHDDSLEFDVTAGITSELLSRLLDDHLDVALAHLPIEGPGLESIVVATYQMVIAMRSDDELSAADSLTIDDLAGRTLITHPLKLQPAAWARRRQILVDAGVTSFREVTSTDPNLAASYVRHARELELTTAFNNAAYESPEFTLVPVDDPRAAWGAALVWRTDVVARDETVQAIVKLVTDRFADAPLEF